MMGQDDGYLASIWKAVMQQEALRGFTNLRNWSLYDL